MKVFLDSDVIISSLISKTGAAYLLIDRLPKIDKIISNLSIVEIKKVAQRLNLSRNRLEQLIENFTITKLSNNSSVKKDFNKYVLDENDAHIIAGASRSKARFLISYNLKDYKLELIKKDFNIIILTPGNFLQYLRSLD